MSEEKDLRAVFRTPHHIEAASVAEMLAQSDIPVEVRIVVQAAREDEAIALIEGYMKSIGSAPNEAPELEEPADLLPCPNCEAPGIALRKPCAGCGYEITPSASAPVFVKEHDKGAQSFCPECRDPLTYAGGKCGACSEELEPLEAADRLCPSLEHVLYRDTVGGFVCKACKRVWVDLAA